MTFKPCTHGVVAVTFSSSEQFNGMKTVRQCQTRHRFWIASHSKRCPLLERNCKRHSEKKSEVRALTDICAPFVSLPGRFQVGLVVPDLGTLLSWQIQDIHPYKIGWSVNLACDTGKGLHTCFAMPCFFYSLVWKKRWSLQTRNTGSGCCAHTIGCWSGPILDRPILRSISFRLPAHSW